jgi:hypothetical protein
MLELEIRILLDAVFRTAGFLFFFFGSSAVVIR